MTIDLDKLKTGDLLLFSAHLSFNPLNIFSLLIEFFTKKPYSHIGMILRDPTWIKPDLKGLYLWESTFEGTPDPQDGKIKLGVQITPIEKVLKIDTAGGPDAKLKGDRDISRVSIKNASNA